jgi:hypothetical protein
VAGVVLTDRRPAVVSRAAVVLGALAAAATIGTAAGFAADPNASQGSWLEAFDEVVFALVGVALLRHRGCRSAWPRPEGSGYWRCSSR